uniref:F-box domain-containing protein n=1 Tax=Mycena chlorophos TaxID=658473 RepID=A0ABQ0LJ27_MYCCL|nr:predicted protein [Mycena chlorophos]
MDALPPELISLVAEFLRDDDDSLRSLSLVASRFTELAQRQLFADVWLRRSRASGWMTYTAALRHFDAYPRFLTYIKHVSVLPPYTSRSYSDETVEPALTALMSAETALAAVLARIPHPGPQSALILHMEWGKLSPVARTAIEGIAERTTREVSFRHVQTLPLHIILHCVRFCASMTFYCVENIDRSAATTVNALLDMDTEADAERLGLTSLYAAQSPELIALLPPPTIRNLKFLHIEEQSKDIPEFLSLVRLSGCASTLEELNLIYTSALFRTNTRDTLPPHLPQLHTLRLTFRDIDFSTMWDPPYSANLRVNFPETLCSLLHATSEQPWLVAPALRYLRINMRVFVLHRPPSDDDESTHKPTCVLPASSMAALDDLFVRYLDPHLRREESRTTPLIDAGIELGVNVLVLYNTTSQEEHNEAMTAHREVVVDTLERGLAKARSVGKGVKIVKWDGKDD